MDRRQLSGGDPLIEYTPGRTRLRRLGSISIGCGARRAWCWDGGSLSDAPNLRWAEPIRDVLYGKTLPGQGTVWVSRRVKGAVKRISREELPTKNWYSAASATQPLRSTE